jgi:two-component system CheB/CheR fusion protein
LLTNAVKFSAHESKIIVKLERVAAHDGERAKAMIQVMDSGKGIEADFLPQIFDRFSQEDSSSMRIHGGLGLGLAIVRNLVELQEGSILAESMGDQRGATFTVLLPIASDQVPLVPEVTLVDSIKGSANTKNNLIRLDGLRVLVVDDEANTREAFGELLGSLGAKVKVAESAQEALNVFAQFNPHVLVSDIAMPGEDGYVLIKKIRSLGVDSGGDVPALAMTAYAGVDDIQRAHLAGFQVHLSKPVDGQHLAKAIFKLASSAQ